MDENEALMKIPKLNQSQSNWNKRKK